MDEFGLEVCTATTLVFGQIQMLLNLFGHANANLMMASFFAYTMFRARLYPVFISSITSRLGFKYFGLLLGIGFALSGLGQSLFPFLVSMIRGTCHIVENSEGGESCDHGHWDQSETIVLAILTMLLIVPFVEHVATLRQKAEIQHVLQVSV